MPLNMYPPIMKSTQPAFLYTTTNYVINFSLQRITSFSDIGHIQIRVVKQTNNRTMVNTSLYPDGIIYKDAREIDTTSSGYSIGFTIPSSTGSNLYTDLFEPWEVGGLYKIQIRFGTNPKYNPSTDTNFATWKRNQIEANAFSEWSTVMVIKAISQPTVQISSNTSISGIESSTTPMFLGSYYMSSASKEALDSYCFNLLDVSGNQIETSGWLQHNSSVNSIDSYRFSTVLQIDSTYRVEYQIKTVNGYEASAAPYTFIVRQVYLNQIDNLTIRAEGQTPYCRENGCINVIMTAHTTEHRLSGFYVITRSSEDSNFNSWQDIHFCNFSNGLANDTIIFQDFTVESGRYYKYAIQQLYGDSLRSNPLYIENGTVSTDFEYSYLYRDGVQLRIMLNQKLNSFKHTVLRTKQDTLGSRYPYLTQNGAAYYAEFQIGGLITFQMDEDQTFFTRGTDGYYYKGALAIPYSKFEDINENEGGGEFTAPFINSNFTYDNIYIERIFREKVEEFLNDFNCKLFKSPTEGNIVVSLMNVSLSPNEASGRMICDFSATAYEVLDNTLDNLNEAGIIDIQSVSQEILNRNQLSFGQIRGVYGATNLYNKIKEQEETVSSDGYQMVLQRVTSIWVEAYPAISNSDELTALAIEKARLFAAGEDTTAINKEINTLNQITSMANKMTNTDLIVIRVNGNEVIVRPNRIYNLSQPITSLQLDKSSGPIILNYICEVQMRVATDSQQFVTSIDIKTIWGQTSGVFTETSSVLKAYSINYRSSSNYRVYNPQSIKVIYDAQGNIISDGTNYNVYRTQNLYEVIKQVAWTQMEQELGEKLIDNGDGGVMNRSGRIHFYLRDIELLDIEADEGTIIDISRYADGSSPTSIMIGPTQRYILRPANELINYARFKNPSYAIINFRGIVMQYTRGR